MVMRSAFVVLAGVSLVGCSGESSSPTLKTKSIQVQGKSPADYFNQFLYRVEGSCENPGKIRFRYLSSEDVSHGHLPNGNPVITQVRVYLRADQSFSADYVENEVLEYIPNGYASRTLLEKKLKGSWRIDDERIVLEGVGNGTGVKFNGKDAVLFVFDHNISRQGLKGKVTFLRFPIGTSGEQSINEYCGISE